MKTSFPETTLTALPPDHGKTVLCVHRLVFNICDLTVVVGSLCLLYRNSSTRELKEGENVEFTVVSFQHANGVVHIDGALL